MFTKEQQKVNRALWIKELRETKEKQCTYRLQKKGRGFCCLGIACEVAIKNGLTIQTRKLSDNSVQYDNEVGTLPPRVKQWLGMKTPSGSLPESLMINGVACGSLASLNDRGASFKEIAEVIESHAHVLFED